MTSPDTASQQALAVARTLLDPGVVASVLTPYAAPTLAYGLAGTALLHACLSHHDPAFHTAALRHWDAAARLIPGTPPDGIHTGPGALAASLIIGTGYLPGPAQHHQAIESATTWLSARAQALADHQRQRLEARLPGTPWAVYDAIKGLAGIGRTLLAAHTAGHTTAHPGLTAALTTLTTMITTNRRRPGWWLPAADHPATIAVPTSGAASTGLAHGIAGPISFLSTAYLNDARVPRQAEAIHTATSWLLDWQNPDGTWPAQISGDQLDRPPGHQHTPANGRHHAWCYGTPGISTALIAAGRAIDVESLTRVGHSALSSLHNHAPACWDIEGPTVCHGSAGILHIANITGNSELAWLSAHHTLSYYDPARPHRFPHIEHGAHLNQPGFLTGAAGTALVLADHSGLLPSPATTWDALLLLS